MYNKLYEVIMGVDFKQAEQIFMKMSSEEQREIMEKLAYDTESMIVYAFVQYINTKNESIILHEIEFDMLTNALCHIEGAYQIALFHNQRLIELVPDSVKYLEWMLSFYDVKVINKEKALEIANKILKMDSDNMIGKDILDRLD